MPLRTDPIENAKLYVEFVHTYGRLPRIFPPNKTPPGREIESQLAWYITRLRRKARRSPEKIDPQVDSILSSVLTDWRTPKQVHYPQESRCIQFIQFFRNHDRMPQLSSKDKMEKSLAEWARELLKFRRQCRRAVVERMTQTFGPEWADLVAVGIRGATDKSSSKTTRRNKVLRFKLIEDYIDWVSRAGTHPVSGQPTQTGGLVESELTLAKHRDKWVLDGVVMLALMAFYDSRIRKTGLDVRPTLLNIILWAHPQHGALRRRAAAALKNLKDEIHLWLGSWLCTTSYREEEASSTSVQALAERLQSNKVSRLLVRLGPCSHVVSLCRVVANTNIPFPDEILSLYGIRTGGDWDTLAAEARNVVSTLEGLHRTMTDRTPSPTRRVKLDTDNGKCVE